ncbi:hypothetical protein [uncultured Adlercreutzia sp.]|uniref:hypothetical protein n=1 Tax=uncultured Adlercreutzia sp. TaxID=875803 RepID=UPI00258A8438|nr:hypothetical protein [uncultured Adlercreutzia sp.]
MQQARSLKRAIFYGLATLAMLVGIGAAMVLASQWHPMPEAPEALALERFASDRDLLTPQEKEWARESGVGSYWYDSTHYVDEGLPSVYWR